MEIANNAVLTNLDGLSKLAAVGYWTVSDESLIITDNPALTSIKGLRKLNQIPGTLQIENNTSLPNLDGLNSVTQVGLLNNRNVNLLIKGNTALTNINGLSSVNFIGGYYTSQVGILNNPALTNLNGLSSLSEINGGFGAGLAVINNVSLTNADGLSSLTNIRANYAFLKVTNNPNLIRGCILYLILHNNEIVCPATASCISVTISGNGVGFITETILAEGPCSTLGVALQPSALLFSSVSDKSMTVSFTAPIKSPLGYIVLMRAYGSPFPEDMPVDGTIYQVGNVIGSSTIVVGIGNATSFNTTYLSPNTPYYVDVLIYTTGYDYLTINPLAGNQRTNNEITPHSSDPLLQPSNLIFSEVTDNSMTLSFTAAVEIPTGYITLMRELSSAFPEDTPVDGTTYPIGTILGTSTIVVGSGPETSLNIIWLSGNMNYFFDVFSYVNNAGTYDYVTINPLGGNQRTTFGFSIASTNSARTSPFPNPFTTDTTIPFTTNLENTEVQIVIYPRLRDRIF